MSHICPVCGYPELNEEPHSPINGASYEICPSCGFQFGFDDDDRGVTYLQWRQQWVDSEMPWTSRGRQPPRDWNPYEQLKKIIAG